MTLVDLLGQPFMQRALLAALITGLSAPVVGIYLVQRRLSLMGDGIGHVAVTGVALGLLTGTSPTITAIAVAIVGAIAIELIRQQGQTGGDLALALLFYGGIAGGVFITGLAGQSAARLNEFLFGSITSISRDDIAIISVLAVVVLVIGVGLQSRLAAIAADPDFARTNGLNVTAYNVMIAVIAAVTVTIAMRTVGLLLVAALMVVPVATAQLMTRSFRSTLVVAIGFGVAASVGGLLIAAQASLSATVQPGSTIVLTALTLFGLVYPASRFVRGRARVEAGVTRS